MQQGGVRADQVTQIRGYADQFLRVKNDPYDPSNRRISILVKNGADGSVPPPIKNGRADSPPPAAPAAAAAAKGVEGKEAAGEKKGDGEKAGATAAAPIAKPAAGTPAAAAKPGLMGKLMGMLPGKKK